MSDNDFLLEKTKQKGGGGGGKGERKKQKAEKSRTATITEKKEGDERRRRRGNGTCVAPCLCNGLVSLLTWPVRNESAVRRGVRGWQRR